MKHMLVQQCSVLTQAYTLPASNDTFLNVQSSAYTLSVPNDTLLIA